jgi:hypothetical protein
MRVPFLLVPVSLLVLVAVGPVRERQAAAAPRAPVAHRDGRASQARHRSVGKARPRATGSQRATSAARAQPAARTPPAEAHAPAAGPRLAELVQAADSTTTSGPANHDGGADGGQPGPTPPSDPLPVARLAMEQLARNLQHVQRIRAKAAQDTFTADCLAEKVAEARVGVQLGDEEMARLHAGIVKGDTGEQAYALHRLQLLVDRASTVLDGARICAMQDPGGITATKVEVEVSPAVPRGDPTAPPTPFQPVERPPEQ